MTVHTLMARAPGFPLPGGYYFRFEAINPSTGAEVTGVTVDDVAVYGLDARAAAYLETLGSINPVLVRRT